MNCKYHQIEKVANCNICGANLCQNCCLNVNNKIYCKDCLKNQYQNENNKIMIREEAPIIKYTKTNNNLFLYLLNFIPGCLPLYLGDKKGLIYLILFCISVGFEFGTLATITFFYSFYQGLNTKRKIDKINYFNENNLPIPSHENLNLNTNPNKLFFMLSALIPGCSYLYLGYNKKGLTILAWFFIFAIFFEFAIPTVIIFLYSLCDSLYIKNNIFKDKPLKRINDN